MKKKEMERVCERRWKGWEKGWKAAVRGKRKKRLKKDRDFERREPERKKKRKGLSSSYFQPLATNKYYIRYTYYQEELCLGGWELEPSHKREGVRVLPQAQLEVFLNFGWYGPNRKYTFWVPHTKPRLAHSVRLSRAEFRYAAFLGFSRHGSAR